MLGSALIADDQTGISRTLTFERRRETHYEASHGLRRPPYNVAIMSESERPNIPNSLFIETSGIGEILARAENGAAAYSELPNHMEQTKLLASGLEVETASETIKAQVERAERAEATLALPQTGSRANIEEPSSAGETPKGHEHSARIFDATATEIQSSASAPLVELELLRAELTQIRSELAAACSQRDVLRTSFRHANLLAESRLKQGSEVKEIRQRNAEWEGRVADLENRAAEWEQRYLGLRRRLEAILKRFGILGASRLFPRRLRAFVRNRVLGPGRTQ